MLKYKTYIACILLMLFASTSCEEVMDVELKDFKEVIVIEALMASGESPFTVKISKTTPYFNAPSGNPVSGAIVSVKTDKGNVKFFTESKPGLYELHKTHALPGFWYTMEVEYEGVKYTARSYMHEMVQIGDLGFTYFDGFGIFDSGYKVNTFIRDPVGIENYYRLKYFVNGKVHTGLGNFSLYSDQLFDGKAIGLGQRSVVFKKTDTLTIELQSIDKATYDYFSTLESISGLDVLQSVSPSNPISNFDNGALGYFSAYTTDSKTVVIEDYVDE
ncbi:MAG TPA: DUF4249 domain-containing protein [Prolixibacteraceae bacterium]|nr:DUF4249 domain-containing protein [Prolixibacteraceae bacterium]